MSDANDQVSRFMRLFPSVPDRVAFINNADEIEQYSGTEKQEIDFERKPRSPTPQDFRNHLFGEGPSLSLTPLVPNPSNRSELNHCKWAVIDFDLYPEFQAGTLHKGGLFSNMEKIAKFIPVHSKSGGMHAFIFFEEAQEASSVRAFLAYVKNSIGLPPHTLDRVEIFPKQDKISPTDSGSAMSLPYFATMNGACKRSSFNDKMLTLDLNSFLKRVESNLTELPELKAPQEPQEAPGRRQQANPGQSRQQYDESVVQLLKGPYGVYAGPPCFLTLMASGQKLQVGRNNRAYDLGVYLRKAWGGEEEDREKALARGIEIIKATFDLESPSRFTMTEARAALASGYEGNKSFKCDEIRGLERNGLLVCDKKITTVCSKCRHGLGSSRFAELHDLVPAYRRMQDNQTTRVCFRVKMVGQGDMVSQEVSMPLADFADYRRVKTAVANKTGYLFIPPVGDDGRVKRFDDVWEQFAVELNIQCRDVHHLPDRSYGSLIKPVIQAMIDAFRIPIRQLPESYDPSFCIIDEGSGEARKQAVLFTHETLVSHVQIAGGRAEEVRKIDDLMTAIDQLCERERKFVTYSNGEAVEFYVCLLAKNDLMIRSLRRKGPKTEDDTIEVKSHFDQQMERMLNSSKVTEQDEREFLESLPKHDYEDIGPLTYDGPDDPHSDIIY